jgi:hypothetical protein
MAGESFNDSPSNPPDPAPEARVGRASNEVPRSRRSRILRLILCVLVPYLAVVIMLTGFQRRLIYFPFRDKAIRSHQARLPGGRVHEIAVAARDGLHLNGWHVLAQGRACNA